MNTRAIKNIALMAIFVFAVDVQAAFIVEAYSPGLANANFQGAGRTSDRSTAPGTTAVYSLMSTNEAPADWTYSYTIGVDEDNYLPAAGTDLTNGLIASGLVGGVPGLYNVYMTWPRTTTTKTEGCKITVTNYLESVVLNPVLQNNGGTGEPGGNNGWYKIADRVPLIWKTYTVNQVANNFLGYCGQRSHGVMWELREPFVPVADLVESDGATSVEEGGDVDAYSVVLKERPPTTIIVTLQISEPNQITLNGTETLELTFTPDNWNVPQAVQVVAVADSAIEPEDSVWVLHMTSVPDANFVDTGYEDAFAGLLTVHVRDYDKPDVRIVESAGATEVSEGGAVVDSYTAVLLYPPAVNVTLKIATDGQTLVDTGAGPDVAASLLFTPANYSAPRTILVTAADDDVLEGDHASVITHAVESLDGSYHGIPVSNVQVTVLDNECGAWGYLPLDFNTDCVVNLADLMTFAEMWLECTQPYGDLCRDMR